MNLRLFVVTVIVMIVNSYALMILRICAKIDEKNNDFYKDVENLVTTGAD